MNSGDGQPLNENELSDASYRRDHPTALPRLNVEQQAAVEAYGRPRTFADGDYLLRAGETEFRFQLIRSGRVEISDRSSGTRRVLLVHQPGEFLGDLANLAGRSGNVDAVAVGPVEATELTLAELQRMIGERPHLGDLVLRAFIERSRALVGRPGFTGVRVIGSQYSRDTFRIREFLARNSVLYTWISVEDDAEVGALLEQLKLRPEETPVVSFADDWLLRNPSNSELARRLGLTRTQTSAAPYDLAIVGGGPAGLAAAVYSASEGLNTIVLDRHAPGGQAAGSARIENYLGFPTGITGAELTSRAVVQAQKFGAGISTPAQVTGLHFEGRHAVLELADGETVSAKALLIASGANYRKLQVPGRERFDSTGVYYAATQVEAKMCAGGQVAVVGAGNSAGQGAVFLAEQVQRVVMLVRGDDPAASMSHYLLQRIRETPNIELLTNTEIAHFHGEQALERVELVNNLTGEKSDLPVTGVFSFIGADPCTEWLPAEIATDRKGFVRTGQSLVTAGLWAGSRPPFLLETSRPGVFAAGDVRSDSVKRVASAVGEGSMAIQFVHAYLGEF